MKITGFLLTMIVTALFASLCVTPVCAQTKQELKLYDRIMKAQPARYYDGNRHYVKVKGRTLRQLAELNNDDLLCKIALTHQAIEIQIAAAREIDDRERLKPLLLEDFSIAEEFMGTLTSEEAITVLKQAKFDIPKEGFKRSWLLRGISNQQVLYDILLDESLVEFHFDVLFELEDPGMLMELAKDDSRNPDFRSLVLSLLDTASLEELALSGIDDLPLMMAIGVRTGKSDWDTEIGKSQDIGEVIDAMVLVPAVARPSVANITEVCHQYIRKGDEAKIPDLESLLMDYGDVTLAEDYLNCGNRRLYDAAVKWGKEHGYNIGTGNGSARVGWGSQR